MSRFYTSRFAFLSILLIWFALRVPTALTRDATSDWEIGNAKKLLDYGFLKRGGATLYNFTMTGNLPYPEDLNLVDHPYPTIWMFLPAYAVGGAAGCIVLVLAARLFALWCTYALLKRYFSPQASWWATLLYATAPIMIALDGDPNAVATAGIIWPFAAWQALKVGETGKGAWLLAIVVFLGPQLGWIAHLMAPSLLVFAWPSSNPRLRDVKQWLFSPGILAIVGATIVAVVLFVAQIVLYSKDIWHNLGYVGLQMGQNPGVGRVRMYFVDAARAGWFLGPALAVSAFVGLWRSRRISEMPRLVKGAIMYLPSFLLFILVLVRFCYIERSPYYCLVFPAAVLAAVGFEKFFPLLLRLALLFATAIPAGYTFLSLLIPSHSNGAKAISVPIAQYTRAEDIISTNLVRFEPPFESWDTNVILSTAAETDRVIGTVRNVGELNTLETVLGRNFQKGVFVLADPGPPIEPEIAQMLEKLPLIGSATVTIAPEPTSMAMKIRQAIWRFSGRFQHQPGDVTDDKPVEVTLRFYRMK